MISYANPGSERTLTPKPVVFPMRANPEPGAVSGVGELSGDGVCISGESELGVGDGWPAPSPGAEVVVSGDGLGDPDRLNRLTNEAIKARIETSKETCATLVKRLFLSWSPAPVYIRPLK